MIYRGGVIRKIRNAEGGGRGLSVALRSYLKAWVKCGKRVTIGGGGKKKSPKIALRILRTTPETFGTKVGIE